MYRGSLQNFYQKKVTNESLDVSCLHFNVEIIKMRQYLTNIIKYDTTSDYTKEKIDHLLDSFVKFHKKYIITSIDIESYNASFPEESSSPPPGFINQENETIRYFNATIQLL